MKPSDSNTSNESEHTGSTPILATETWHRFVIGICLLACVAIIVMGIDRLFDPTQGRAVAARPTDYIAAICFMLLGVQGCRFLIRQFRAPASGLARKQQNPK
jgi:hypothetical protein